MSVLITGSSGHLGEALARTLQAEQRDYVGLDIKPSPFTTMVGSVADRSLVSRAMRGIERVYHTATLHKPHIATHSVENFIETNVRGTRSLLEEAAAAGVKSFIFTSTTSVYGHASRPPKGQAAAWITEEVEPVPKNIYGVTKIAAENFCRLVHRTNGLNCIILRTSRFFPEEDDDKAKRGGYEDANIKANEFLYRRVELEDVVSAHIAAAERAEELRFGCFIVSATTPFESEDSGELNDDAPAVLSRRYPACADVYDARGWRMFPTIDRVYVNRAAREALGWEPKYDFARIVTSLRAGAFPKSAIAAAVGSKGYHDRVFEDGPYPVLE